MPEALPVFLYHPDPVATGMVVARPIICACCGKARGHVYIGPVYAREDYSERICPWCIADGSAAAKLDASFSDAHPLIAAGMGEPIVEEVNLRTPGYISWQQDEWLTHCNDACEFHGDATTIDVREASAQTKACWLAAYKQDDAGWEWATKEYQPGGDSALYKFRCRHCGLVLFGWDLS
jgi:uncharacterized protein